MRIHDTGGKQVSAPTFGLAPPPTQPEQKKKSDGSTLTWKEEGKIVGERLGRKKGVGSCLLVYE
jgi:hypothetical protein